MAGLVTTDISTVEKQEYGSCGHSSIVTRTGAERLVEFSTSSNLQELRNSIHGGGHVDLGSADLSVGDTAFRITEQLTGGYQGVITSVINTPSGSTNPLELVTEDASLAAMAQRIIQVGLIGQVGAKGIPDLDKARADLQGILSYHNEEEAGLMLAQILATFKAGDRAAALEGEYPLATQIMQRVFDLALDKIERQAPSPVRRYLVASGFARYEDGFRDDYPNMLRFGDILEVDLCLHAFGQFVEDQAAGENERSVRAGSYLAALRALKQGNNSFTPVGQLSLPSAYGEGRTLTVFRKLELLEKQLGSIRRGAA